MRLTKSDKEATYMTFRQWLGAASISEDMWSTVVEEDENFDYQNVGVGRDVVVAHEVEIASTDADEDDSID